MPDDFEPDVANEPEPGDEPTPDDAAPEGEPAEPQGDASADDAPAPDGDEPTKDDDEPSPAQARSERLERLLAKYGGDEEKMVDAYFEQARSMSDLTKKVDQLLELQNSKNLTPEAEAKLIAEDPDVREVGAELSSLDADIKQYRADDKILVGEFGRLETLVQSLKAKLEFAPDDVVRENIGRQIVDAEREQRVVGRDWRANQVTIRNAERQLQHTVRQFRDAETKAKAKREQAQKQEWGIQAEKQATRKEFTTAFRAEAEAHGLKLDTRTYAVLNQSMKDRLSSYLRSLGPEAEGIDIFEAVGVLFEEYAEVMGLKRSGLSLSKQKNAVRTKPAGSVAESNPKNPPKDKSGKYWDPKFTRERAKQLLGG